jgi:hypothetical protein
MKPHSIVFAIALLAGCAMSRGPAVMPGGDYQASLKGMEAAQAQASQPGDENLTCDQLQEQMLAIAQDPAFLEHVEAAGAAAEKDMAQMQIGKRGDHHLTIDKPPGTQAQPTAKARKWVDLLGAGYSASAECGCVVKLEGKFTYTNSTTGIGDTLT